MEAGGYTHEEDVGCFWDEASHNDWKREQAEAAIRSEQTRPDRYTGPSMSRQGRTSTESEFQETANWHQLCSYYPDICTDHLDKLTSNPGAAAGSAISELKGSTPHEVMKDRDRGAASWDMLKLIRRPDASNNPSLPPRRFTRHKYPR